MDGEQSFGGELWEFAELREVGEALIKVVQSLAVQGELSLCCFSVPVSRTGHSHG
jgi:hypothetical protein